MKFSILIILMVVTFCRINSGNAQPNKQKVNYLSVGDPAPALKPFKWIKGQRVENFSEGKIYLVSFGATWCSPCAAAIPDLTAMATMYKSDVTVIEVFVMESHNDPPGTKVPSFVPKVEKYVEKKGDKMQYTIAVDDAAGTVASTWIEAAGKIGVPHIFVIDRNGLISWIGSNPKAAEKAMLEIRNANYNISSMMKRDSLISSLQEEYNPLRLMSPESINRLLYFSHLSVYKEGQVGIANYQFIENFRWAKDQEMIDRQGKIQMLGENLRRLYYMAYGDTLFNRPPQMYPPYSGIYPDTIKYPHQRRSYGKYWYRPMLELRDSSLFEANYTSPKNRFNYIAKVPFEKASADFLQKVMQHDLKACFGYEVLVIEKMMPCWELTVPERNRERLKTKTPGAPYKRVVDYSGTIRTTNAQVRDIIFQLESRFGNSPLGNLTHHPEKQPPFIDATGIIGDIDYSQNEELATRLLEEKNLRDTFPDYRKWLEEIGFVLKKSYRKMNVVVIRDPK